LTQPSTGPTALTGPTGRSGATGPAGLLDAAAEARGALGTDLHERLTTSLYDEAAALAARVVGGAGQPSARRRLDQRLDAVLTHRVWGFLVMGALFYGVFWMTIAGANAPSGLLGDLLVERGHAWLSDLFASAGSPAWLSGLLVDGVYLATAWVVAVMLPPMAIFFPLFTLLEDFGYLPRVAFNLDRLFAKAGAHGKQSLSMMMGFGCNAAGVVSTRIIDSPRERLIAILTNNFSICNGRWPTLILIGTIFLGAQAPAALSGAVAAASVVAVAVVGVLTALAVSLALSRTVLRGEVSVYSLELPPYRPPMVWRSLYTSLIDRTLIVLGRAVAMAAPAGAVIWLTSNVSIGQRSVAGHLVAGADPLAAVLGLTGVVLVAYLIAIPANEIIIPTILMLTVTLGGGATAGGSGAPGRMIELGDAEAAAVLTGVGGWTVLTGVNLMLFSLLHNPCSTTILTIYRETRSPKWTAVATLGPLVLAFAVCALTTTVARAAGWV
jgi:ferrous iron transport protein B